LENAKKQILENRTLEEIVVSHGITKRTLNTWLMSLGEDREIRGFWVDNMLVETLEEIEQATDNFPFARMNSK